MATFISENILSEGGITGTTISATTYSNLPTDITITGGTYGSGTATFRNNTGGTFTVTGFLSNATTAVTLSSNVLSVTSSGGTPTNTTINASTGGTYSNGTITLAGTGTLSTITGLFTGSTDVRVTGATYSNNNFTFTNNTGGTFSVLFNTVTGLTTNGNLTVTGTTSSGVISATTYQNLPLDIRVTGGTYSSGTATFTNNTGGTFNVTGFSTGGGGTFTGGTVTGATNFTGGLSANTISGGSIIVSTINSTSRTLSDSVGNVSLNWGTSILYDTNDNSDSILWTNRLLKNSFGNTVLDWENGTLSGMTSISATTISGGTFYGNGSGLTNLTIPYITGNTVAVQARRTTLYLLTGTYTNITFNTTDIENNPTIISHDNTNTDRIYMYESGLYEINYQGDIGQGTAANDFETRLFLNNLTAINGSSLSGKSSSTDRITFASSTIFSATSGDFITLQGRFPALTGGSIGNTVLSVKQLKGIKGDTGSQGPSFTGGTVTGGSNFTGGLTANTISATTYQNLPLDIRVTGGTYSSGTATFTNNTGGTFTVTGFSTGGGGSFTGGTVTGPTNFTNGLTANTISATTIHTTSLSADSMNIVVIPTNDDTNTQILTRNSTTGNVEYRNASSISGGGGSTTGIVYVFANNYQLI